MLQSSINAVIAVGMTLVVMTKGIDLSVGSVVGVSSMIAASLLHAGPFSASVRGAGGRPRLRLRQRLLIAKLKLPDFIVRSAR